MTHINYDPRAALARAELAHDRCIAKLNRDVAKAQRSAFGLYVAFVVIVTFIFIIVV